MRRKLKRKHARIHHSHILQPIHLQILIHNTPQRLGQHRTAPCGVILRVRTLGDQPVVNVLIALDGGAGCGLSTEYIAVCQPNLTDEFEALTHYDQIYRERKISKRETNYVR